MEVATAIRSGDGAAARTAMEAILDDTSRALEVVAAHDPPSPEVLESPAAG
jgi:DNA-binding FadR family transcriptional regulator